MRNRILRTILAVSISIPTLSWSQNNEVPRLAEPHRQSVVEASLGPKLVELEQEVKALKSKSENAFVTAFAAVIAALLAGCFAIWNQRSQAVQQRELTAKEAEQQRSLTAKQAEQERLLKAIELIMQSRNRYEARVRMRNLEPFLTEEVNVHLDRMLNRGFNKDDPGFSGPEWIQLRIRMAETMAAKAENAEQVFAIWKQLLPEKAAVADAKWNA
ncbi:MAG: hypothetical protein JSS56_27395 [Proteobacteria bacterium]|nr:hypothetical protein [Pseudomonadota bacterium]